MIRSRTASERCVLEANDLEPNGLRLESIYKRLQQSKDAAMSFEEWMIHCRSLKASTAKSYLGTIKTLSELANDNELMARALTSLTSQSNFNEVASRIRVLAIFKERNKRYNNRFSCALSKYSEYLAEGYGSDREFDIDSILEDKDLSNTERINLVKSRIGQGTFRQKLISYWSACAITGLKDTSLLVASHIKPWRASNNGERLNAFNGLLLSPNLDKVFDAGLLTFEPSGYIKLSPLLIEADKLGITPNMCVSLTMQHEPFMSFHRTEVYRAT